MNDLAEQIANLSATKRAILDLKLRKRSATASEETIPHRGQFDLVPLSPSQRQLWFLSQLEPESPFYNVASGIRIEVGLNFAALQSALDEVVARHDSLRATFKATDGKPAQVVKPISDLRIPLVDLTGLPMPERKREAQRLSLESARRPFDLSRGPLLAASLICVEAACHEFILTLHHIISDGWSMGVLWRETLTLYETFCVGRPSPLPSLPIQYSDFILWQHDRLQGALLEAQLSYWTRQLAQINHPLPLPLDRPRPSRQSYRGFIQTRKLSHELRLQIETLCRREGVTLFVALLAGFKLLLLRYSGRTDIYVGSPFANRDRTELQGLIGLLINTLVLRTSSAGDPSFRELISRVKETMLGAYAHSDLPFDSLIEGPRLPGELAYNPLLQVMFSLQSAPTAALKLSERDVSPFEIHNGGSKADLALEIRETPAGLIAEIEANADLFDDTTIVRMLRHYSTALESVVANPERIVSQIALLTESESQQALVEWSVAETAPGIQGCVHELFQQRAELSPDAVAVVEGLLSVTYAELNRRSNQIAYRLRSIGVCPESLVAVYLNRSVDFVLSLLAILKAGAAYLPLDPAYPTERLRFMMMDGGVSATITERRLLESLAIESETTILLADEYAESVEEREDDPVNMISPERLAYVIYTSGSTGQPKGVQVTHGALSNLVSWHLITFAVTREDRATQVASLSFDACGWELWPYLSAGVPVYLADDETRLSPPGLRDWMSRIGATISFLPTPLFESFLPSPQSDELEAMRLLLVGGDKLQNALPIKLHLDLVNNYGPTEYAVVATSCRVQAGENGHISSIGRAISNTRLYLLDDQFQPGPMRVPAEIYIGGDGLARGYLGRADITSERFLPEPFSDAIGGRMYRTGDVGRHFMDGSVEFLGRTDHQVKVRGFRIELSEIEVVLRQSPWVAEAIVVARENRVGDTQLIAYVTIREGAQGTAGELRKYLAAKLPEHMLPARILTIDKFPLTPNGKVDRRALPAPDNTERDQSEGIVNARTAVEELLTAVWSDVLGIGGLTRDSNFFESGGHSLLATQLVSRIAERFGVQLDLRSVFESPTIADLAQRIEVELREGRRWEPPPIERANRKDALVLSFAQERLWFFEQLEGSNGVYNCPIGMRVKGEFGVEAFEQAVREVILRQESLQTVFPAEGGRPAQVIKWVERRWAEMVDLSELAEGTEEISERLMREAGRKAFDLEQGPLIRVALIKVGDGEHVIVITMHHIVTDGWSQRLFFKELTQAYEGYGEGRQSGLQEVGIRYADYAAWQRNWMRGESLEGQVEYWRKRIGNVESVMDLAMDRARTAEQRYAGKRKSRILPRRLSSRLREVSLREGATLYMTLLTGFKALLSRYTEREQIVVGTPTAGRNRVEAENLIGFFVNTLVLNSRIEMGMSFREAIGEVREVVLGAHANQDLPFEKLVEELQPARSLSHHPMFQVMFILEERATEELRFRGAEARYEDVDIGVAKFDLTLAVSVKGDRFEAEIEYNEGLFDEERISRMLGHYETLLEGAERDVEARVGELPILTENERHQIVIEWNETERARSKSQRIDELLESQVERTPDRIAVVNGGEALSYKELNRRSNELAGRLREMGVGAEVVVGVCMRRSLKMVVGMIAIMKAGGAYLPLDPEYPDERLEYVVRDAGARIALTEGRHAGRIRDEKVRKLYLDEGGEEWKGDAEGGVERMATGGNLAYVIYTSGSTGRPKGVAIEHRSAVTLIEWAMEVFREEELRRVMASTSICFDLSVFEIFAPLSAGGEVNLVENALEAKEAHDVTLINAVPTVVRELLREGALKESVMTVNMAGEALSGELVGQLRLQQGVRNIYNLYGPSEDTTYSSFARVNESRVTAPPIGRPIADTEIYVLDRQGEPRAVGMPGELYIGGAGLARGYIGQAALTAEKFTPDSIGKRRGGRMYATGDTGRYLSDGSIHYVGRKDQQVKLRGFRIELGEIEEVIGRHECVKEGVVIVREDKAGDRRLVAYVVAADEDEFEIKKLRGYLRAKLPEYMVPGEFVVMNELPLTPNLKVDRKALLLTDFSSSRSAERTVLPKTPTQELLAEIWREMLSCTEVGIEDNFFDLGGHSILATRLVSRIRDTFSVELPLRTIFEEPTVAELASRIDAALKSDERSDLPPIEPLSAVGKAAELSFPQQRIWYLDVLEPGNIAYNIPVFLYLAGELNVSALAQSISRIVCRHSALRTRFQNDEGKPTQVVDADVSISWPIIDINRIPATQREILVGQLARAEARRPFDLTNGPLLRCALLRMGGADYILLLSVHHIIFDEWSMRVVFAELEDHYQAFTSGRCSTLPELKIQYADFARWHREWLMNGALDRQLAYWREKLRGVPATLTIAADRRRPPIQTYAGAYESMDLSEELSHKIEALNKKERVALFVTLLTAFKALICHHTGQMDIVVGTSIANRNRTESESLIGFFVNTLALRTKFDGDPTVSELLRLVQDTVLGAYDHQDVPIERLIEELRPERDARFNPIFQIAFEFQSSPPTMPSLPGLRVLPLSVDPGASHFDLTLGMENNGKQLRATMEYNTDLYDSATIAQLLKDYRTLLESAVADGDQRLSTWLSKIKTASRSALDSDPGGFESLGSSYSMEREIALRRAMLDSRRSRMSAEKRGLLDRRLQGK